MAIRRAARAACSTSAPSHRVDLTVQKLVFHGAVPLEPQVVAERVPVQPGNLLHLHSLTRAPEVPGSSRQSVRLASRPALVTIGDPCPTCWKHLPIHARPPAAGSAPLAVPRAGGAVHPRPGCPQTAPTCGPARTRTCAGWPATGASSSAPTATASRWTIWSPPTPPPRCWQIARPGACWIWAAASAACCCSSPGASPRSTRPGIEAQALSAGDGPPVDPLERRGGPRARARGRLP